MTTTPVPATDSPVEEKHYGRGQHPNSRRNLHPFVKGDVPNPNGEKGPRIKPALAKFADMSVEDFKKLDLKRCTVAEMVALQSLQKAAFDAEFGDRMRIFVTERMDGDEAKKGDTYIDKAILVRYVIGQE